LKTTSFCSKKCTSVSAAGIDVLEGGGMLEDSFG
jgi:hypothetical protein